MRTLKPIHSTVAGVALLSTTACYESAEELAVVRQKAAVDNRANVDGYFLAPAASTFSLAAGSVRPVTWQYTTTAPASNWADPAFNASGWQSGQAGFYGGDPQPGDVTRTWWPDGVPELWLRTNFTISVSDIPNAIFWGRWDDNIEVFINGVRAATSKGWTAGYRYLGLTPESRAALLLGKTNTIAVHALDIGGGRYFDLGITVNDKLIAKNFPATGNDRTPTVSIFGNTVKQYMLNQAIPAGVFAVMKKDQVVANWAFGWQDKAFAKRIQTGAAMRLASNDKVITRAAVRAVLDRHMWDAQSRQYITANTLVFPLLKAHGLTTIGGVPAPTNIDRVTIQHLFDHTGGVQELPDQNTFYADLGITTGTSTPADNVRWVYSHDTSSTPGTRFVYSSSGYMVLRYLVQILTNSYNLVDYLHSSIFNRVGSGDVFLASERLETRQQSEPWYATLEAPYDRWIYLENYTALSSTAQGMVRLLRGYHMETGAWIIDSAGKYAPPDNTMSQYAGGMAGTASYTVQRRSDQVGIAVIFNIGGAYDDLMADLNTKVDQTPDSGWGI